MTTRTHTVEAQGQDGMTLDELRDLVADMDRHDVPGRTVVQARVGMRGQIKRLTLDENRVAAAAQA